MAPPTQSALDVAGYFLWLAANEQPDDPDYLTPLKLQKLLYFAQGWALADWGQPVFVDEIRATPQGPVVRAVAEHFAGVLPITEAPSSPPPVPERVAALLYALWTSYNRWSAFELRRLVLDEPLLKEAIAAQGEGAGEAPIIEQAGLRVAFLEKIEQTKRRFAENATAIHRLAARNTELLRRRSAG